MKNILVTGGAGYIGSHTCVELINAGYRITVLDNLSNSSKESLRRVGIITGTEPELFVGDISDGGLVARILRMREIDTVIHFAGLKSVGESVEMPVDYYRNNLSGTLVLIDEMRKNRVKNMIFSSSATVYGQADRMPVSEESPKKACTNPYGWSKSMLEQILMDVRYSDSDWNIVLLRYFNPAGAHRSGLIGEDPNGIPNNLMPYISKVADGRLDELGVFGDDYDTPDGTGVRDYIHVVDLARGHVSALKRIADGCGLEIYNLGTGKGYSVLEVVRNFEEATGRKVPYSIKPRRAGDLATCYCDPSLAEKNLGWKAEYGMYEMCRDAWKWQCKNPNGYDGIDK